MRPVLLPPTEYLRSILLYDPVTGAFTRKPRPRSHFSSTRAWAAWAACNVRNAGKLAGSIKAGGYVDISIDGGKYYAHRLAWKLMTNEEPPSKIDHHDGNPSNNAWSNLRQGTDSQHAQNVGAKKNQTGFRGVWRNGPGFCAIITEDGVRSYLGTFDTPEEASVAFEIEARRIHGAFYREPPYAPSLIASTRLGAPKERLSASGYRGVYKNRNKFRVRFSENGERRELGSFDTAEQAVAARDAERAYDPRGARRTGGNFALRPATPKLG